ncbi:MAG: hypothetical protein ACJ79S_11590 [Gemmatimonadaceae bacterium]
MRIVPILLAAASLATVACVRTATNPVTGKTDVDIESPGKKGEDWTTTILGKGQYSAVRGSGKALVAEGKTTVTVSLEAATAGAVYPWHVHEGTCASGGPIVGDAAAYTPLTVGNDGRAQGNAQLAVRLDEAHKYFINVHASPSDMATTVACGDLDD